MVVTHKSKENVTLLSGWSFPLGIAALLIAAPAYSQSLGEIARQERERRQEQPRHSLHVYDNEDLARAQILVPEDRERIEASKRATPGYEFDASTSGQLVHEFKMNGLSVADVSPNTSRRRDPFKSERPDFKKLMRSVPALDPTRAKATRMTSHVASSAARVHPASPAPEITHSHPRLHSMDTQNSIADKKVSESNATAPARRIRIERGDTLWSIAKKYLGRGQDWLLLAAKNPQSANPARLLAGKFIELPDQSADGQPGMRVRVQPGDSLWKLTQHQLGDGKNWNCIASANPQIQNADLILPGQIITIPEQCSSRNVSGALQPSDAAFASQAKSGQLELGFPHD